MKNKLQWVVNFFIHGIEPFKKLNIEKIILNKRILSSNLYYLISTCLASNYFIFIDYKYQSFMIDKNH
jgi:hypothetical protein